MDSKNGKPEESVVTRIDFTLDDFECWVTERDYQASEGGLRAILDHLRQEFPLYGATLHRGGVKSAIAVAPALKPFDQAPKFADRMVLYRRLADAIGNLLCDERYRISDRAIKDYLIYKNYLREIFTAAGYSNLDHLLIRLGLLKEGTGLRLTGKAEDFVRFLICYTLDSSVNVDFRLFFRFNREVATWAYFGMLTSCHRVLDRRSEEVRDYFLGIHDVLDQAEFDNDLVQTTPNPWMLCTYADCDHKHELKASLNRAVKRWFDRKVPIGLLKKADRNIRQGAWEQEKPVLLVCAEVMRSTHAMYRCYSPYFLALKARFKVVLAAGENDYDRISGAAFDEVITVSTSVGDIAETAKAILKQRPLVIYYPSLGMNSWTVALCSTRLAPVQVMSGGHPASAYSEVIDFFFLPRIPAEHSRSTLHLRERVKSGQGAYGDSYQPHPDTPDKLPEKTKQDNVIRIAVNSSLMKISPRFIEVCQILTKESKVPIFFHFYIIERGIRLDSTRVTIASMLPNSAVFGQMSYPDYMQSLAQCDLALGTFPFGGSNTNVDLALLGIPKLIMDEASGLAGQTDITFWERFSIQDMMFAQNEFNYLASAIYLIHDAKYRNEVSEYILNQNPQDNLFRPGAVPTREDDAIVLQAFSEMVEETRESLESSPV